MPIKKKVSLDLPHATDETKTVLKSLGKMLFKNSLRKVLALIWSIRPQSTVQHRGFANTKPPSRAVFINKYFFNAEHFFLVMATVKTRPVLKRAWQGLSDNWGTQWVKS